MKIFKILGVGFFILLVATVILEYKRPTPDTFPKEKFELPILIAHAAGAIDGYVYTNSQEALQKATSEDNYKFIELDLARIAGGRIASIHQLKDFNVMTGMDFSTLDSIDSKEITDFKIYDKYHILLDDSINTFFNRDESLFLVTDKIEDLDLLSNVINIKKDRILVEVFSYDKYIAAIKKGFKYPMLAIREKEILEHFKYHMILHKIKIITISLELLLEDVDAVKKVHEMGVCIFVATSNDIDIISKYGKDLITGFYTDSITYSSLKINVE